MLTNIIKATVVASVVLIMTTIVLVAGATIFFFGDKAALYLITLMIVAIAFVAAFVLPSLLSAASTPLNILGVCLVPEGAFSLSDL